MNTTVKVTPNRNPLGGSDVIDLSRPKAEAIAAAAAAQAEADAKKAAPRKKKAAA